MKLISHVNRDGDIIEAWIRHHLGLGVTAFHLIVHGSEEENQTLLDLVSRYPIHIEDRYEGEFSSVEKLRRVTALLDKHRSDWMVWIDSDEFLELPHGSLRDTVRQMERLHCDVLAAPMLQRLSADGSLDSPDHIDDPFHAFPLCSPDLYRRMGSEAAITKYPVFFAAPTLQLSDGGNHGLPHGFRGRPAPFVGVSHHFKWRRNVRDRLVARAASAHPWRHESAGLAQYLAEHEWQLPLEGSFAATTAELRRRGLLGPTSMADLCTRWLLARLPESMDDRVMDTRRRLAHRLGGRARSNA